MRRLSEAALLRTLGFAAAWLILNAGAVVSWPLAVLSVGSATAASLSLRPPGARLRWQVVLRLCGYLLFKVLTSSLDVARRSLSPSLPIDPGFVPFLLRLPPGGARLFFVAVVNLMPGSASVELEGDVLRLHILTRGLAVEQTLRKVEDLLLAAVVDEKAPLL